MEEKWAKIKGYERYEVSNLGRFRHMDNYGKYKSVGGHMMRRGYIAVQCHGGHRGLVTRFLLHRLVAEYFLPNPDNYWTICHINGDNSDNRVENLKWVGKTEIARIRMKEKSYECR